MRQQFQCKDCRAISLGEVGRRTITCKKCGGTAKNMGPDHQVKPVN